MKPEFTIGGQKAKIIIYTGYEEVKKIVENGIWKGTERKKVIKKVEIKHKKDNGDWTVLEMNANTWNQIQDFYEKEIVQKPTETIEKRD